MSNEKHTPGPWEASEYVGAPFRNGERGARVDAAATADYPATRPIAIVHGTNAVWLREGQEVANTRLIAAAPEMFAALDPRSLEVVADEIDGPGLGATRAASLRAIAVNQRAAIALAKYGRSAR